MRKYFTLTFNYIFFLTTIIFLPLNVGLYVIIFLFSLLVLENIYFVILPLVLIFFLPLNYTYVVMACFILNLCLYYFIKKNRYYALTLHLLTNLIVFIFLFVVSGYNKTILEVPLFLLVIYAIINLLYNFQKINNNPIILSYNHKLINLTTLLAFLVIIFFYTKENLLIYLLFMQLYLIKDYKYNVLFGIALLTLSLIFKSDLNIILNALCTSFIPVSINITANFKNNLAYIILVYSILINLFNFKDKNLSIDNDYINNLFDDFKKYLNALNTEYEKNLQIKQIKETKLKEISLHYCDNCQKNTLCKSKIEKRYAFLSQAMLGSKQNIYDCPYYNQFKTEINCEKINSSYEYSAIKLLAHELSYLYNQSLVLKPNYEKFLKLLSDYGYKVLNLDINLANKSLYFSLTVANKAIIETTLLKCAYKAFGEKLNLKVVENVIYFFKPPKIKINYAHTVLAKEGNLVSGDNYYIKKDYNSSYMFILSDGMGSGYNAYQESIDALNTIKTLISYHFRLTTILKLLEDIYELRSNYDRYATLDFLQIDSANAKLNLYKMGSSTTYILHNNNLYTYENKALPLKLDEVNSAYELDIYSGDYIFLISDGISDFINKNEFYEIVKDKNANADELCYDIIDYIKKKENNDLKDDLSLIVIKAI